MRFMCKIIISNKYISRKKKLYKETIILWLYAFVVFGMSTRSVSIVIKKLI